MPDDQTLAQRIRAKFPDAYTDLSDQELEAKIKAKYPGTYDDIPLTQSAATPKPEESSLTVGNVLRGAEKGAVGTFVGLGELVHQIPGVTQAVDALYGTPGVSQQSFKEANQAVTPQNAGETVGKTAEQVGEFFIPVTKTARLAKAPEIIKAGLLGAAQSEGSPGAGLASAALTAVIPGAGTVKKLAGLVGESAESSMARALGATKEKLKAEAEKLAPEMLKRGIGGTRRGMRELAKRSASIVGNQLDAAYDAAEKAGETIPSILVQGNLQLASDALKVKDATGVLRVIPGYEAAAQKMDELGSFAASLGADIPVKKARLIRQLWDDVVEEAGLFGHQAAASAAQKPTSVSMHEAANSFRDLLNQNPTIDALNKESAFWSGMNKVLKKTKSRTQSQTGGLFGAMGMSTGAVAGSLSGDSYTDRAKNAALGAVMGRGMVKLLQSPYWQSKVSGPLKDKLATALASGSAGSVASASSKIMAALPPQLRAQLAQ